MNKKVSLKDIAKAVGVSTALVSYVLNNKEKEARVGREIAEIIRQKAAELNYQPNQLAKSLKSGKSDTIGLIVADISNPFFANIARTIEDAAKPHGYTVIFGSSDEQAAKSKDLIDVFLKRQVDGIILAPAEHSEEQIYQLNAGQTPYVLIDRYFPEIDSDYVVTDNFEAAYAVTEHLIQAGYARIGMIGYEQGLVHMQERARGYRQALKDHGIADSRWKGVHYEQASQDVPMRLEELLRADPPVDALFFATNTLAVHGLHDLDRRLLRVPEDLAVVCFDQGDAFDFFYSPLTYIRQPLTELGIQAVNSLIKRIQGHRVERQQVRLKAELIVRRSSSR